MSFIIPVKGESDKFIISHGRDILLISWKDNSDKITIISKIASLDDISDKKTLRLNDGKADSSGRLWFGTLASDGGPPENGAGGLYSLEESGMKAHVEGTTISNGLTWDVKRNKFYFIDSPKRSITQYDFDLEKGEICKFLPRRDLLNY